jgi:hypothetical protein
MLDYKLLDTPTEAKSFNTLILSKMKLSQKNHNYETYMFLKSIREKYIEFEKPEKVNIDCWKGKSSLKLIESDKGWEVWKWQKFSPDSKPRKMTFIFPKDEIRDLKKSMSFVIKNKGKEFTSKELCEQYCRIAKKYYSGHNKPLFYKNKFIWDNYFSDRYAHIKLTIFLQVLRKQGLIEYCAGRIRVL